MSDRKLTAGDIPFAADGLTSKQPQPSQFERVGEGHYQLTIGDHGIIFDVDRLWREKDELRGELTVWWSIYEARNTDGCVSAGSFNLSSTRARTERAGQLAKITNTKSNEIRWDAHLEELCQKILGAERAGQPAVLLHTVAKPDPVNTFEVDGLVLPLKHPTILFGDGGTAKSLMSLWIAGHLARRGWRVGYADWELTEEEHRERLERLFGSDMPTSIYYIRCERPMIAEADRLRRLVQQHRLDYIICDSVAFASDGQPEAAETAGKYFRAVRQLGIGSLHIAHITKGSMKEGERDKGEQKPFGSVFWHNSARSTWFVKLAEASDASGRLSVGVYNRKNNLGALRPAVGFGIAFSAERIDIRRIDLAQVAELAAGLPLWRRCVGALRQGPQTVKALAEELDANGNSIEKALKRQKHVFQCITNTPDGIHKWGLVERRVA